MCMISVRDRTWTNMNMKLGLANSKFMLVINQPDTLQSRFRAANHVYLGFSLRAYSTYTSDTVRPNSRFGRSV